MVAVRRSVIKQAKPWREAEFGPLGRTPYGTVREHWLITVEVIGVVRKCAALPEGLADYLSIATKGLNLCHFLHPESLGKRGTHAGRSKGINA
jgi:hypothetical protein